MNIILFISIQVITFIVLFLLGRKMISASSAQEAKRLRRLNDEVIKKSEQIDIKLAEADEQANIIKEAAQQQAQELKAQTMKDVEALKDDLLNKARQESDRIIQQAHNTKERIKEELIAQNTKHVTEQALKFLREVLSAKSLQAAHKELLHELIEQINSLDTSRLQIQFDKGELLSPFEVDQKDKDKIIEILSAKTGKPIALEVVMKKELVGGICIKLGSFVIDGSLAKKLNEAAQKSRTS